MYIGRFAPTPSGPLHFGSLIAAVGSYLQAKTNKGSWLLRMEDTDLQRNKKGADTLILHTLEHFGFEWEGQVEYQTKRSEFYEQALTQLADKELTYHCQCSRKTIIEHGHQGEFGIIYANTCLNKKLMRSENSAIRLQTPNKIVTFTDQHFGEYQQNLAKEIGDFHLLRRDQCYAYHLAVVVDDHEQQISEVVRGYDILDSTPRQIYLQECLSYSQPSYLHLPLAVNEQGMKLSKHTFAEAIDKNESTYFLYKALLFLGQDPEKKLQNADQQAIWQWAIQHWDKNKIPRQHKIHFHL